MPDADRQIYSITRANLDAFDRPAFKLEHGLYARRLEKLDGKAYLTEPEKVEQIKLKKLKLHLKDQMERLRRL